MQAVSVDWWAVIPASAVRRLRCRGAGWRPRYFNSSILEPGALPRAAGRFSRALYSLLRRSSLGSRASFTTVPVCAASPAGQAADSAVASHRARRDIIVSPPPVWRKCRKARRLDIEETWSKSASKLLESRLKLEVVRTILEIFVRTSRLASARKKTGYPLIWRSSGTLIHRPSLHPQVVATLDSFPNPSRPPPSAYRKMEYHSH